MTFTTTILSVVSLCLLAIPGFILVKLRVLSPKHVTPLVTLLLYVAQPLIIADSFMSISFETSLLGNMGIVILAGVVSQVVMVFLAKLIFKYDKNKSRGNAYACASAFSNAGFMGIPMTAMLLPGNSEAIIYLTMYLVTFNLLLWTVGVYALTGEKKYISIKKAILNPPIIALLVTLPFFFFNVKFPNVLTTPISYLAGINTPLAMIILGMRLACIRVRDLFVGSGVYISSFLKLIIAPLLVYAVMFALPIDPTVTRVVLIMTAMPAANSCLLMAERYGGDTVAATKAVMLSTVLSIAILPLIMMLPL